MLIDSAIDVERCPVTLVPLTHSKLQPSDWSIDRLNNNGAYAPGNLAVMSTHANRAKGDKSFPQVHELSQGTEAIDGLLPREWARLASMMHAPCAIEIRDVMPVPLATRPPPITLTNTLQDLQDAITYGLTNKVNGKAVLTSLRKHCPRNFRDRLDILLIRVRDQLHGLSYPYDVWLDQVVFELLTGWLAGFRHDDLAAIKKYLGILKASREPTEKEFAAWSLETRGYNSV